MDVSDQLAARVGDALKEAAELYHRLVLVVGPPHGGKSELLRRVAEQAGAPYLNVNLELSRCLLDLSERQRTLRAVTLLREIVGGEDGAVVLDSIGILFDRSLRLDPLRCLQDLSRNRVVVAAWDGWIDGKLLTYARPEHPEYYRAPARGLLLVPMGEPEVGP